MINVPREITKKMRKTAKYHGKVESYIRHRRS